MRSELLDSYALMTSSVMDDMPKELFDEIYDLTLAIVNAGSVGDDAVAESVRLRMRELYDAKVKEGEVKRPGHNVTCNILAQVSARAFSSLLRERSAPYRLLAMETWAC